ncbi:hypothetical protein [Dickeya dadantii]|uniref:hypothetical protein n=1 Tax=Dickeya dadantii TaxID=204038 RepID=UPI0021D96842|nr:hypothetical protein [Dickeya dadantii]
MKYGKWFFVVSVGGFLLSAFAVQAAEEPLIKPYVKGQTKTLVVNASGHCLAISRKDGQMIGDDRLFGLGDVHGRQLPADHPSRMHVVFVPSNDKDTKYHCVNDVNAPSNKSRDDIKFNETVVAIIASDVPR